MKTVAEEIGVRVKADVDRLVGIAQPVEQAVVGERQRAAAVARQRRYWRHRKGVHMAVGLIEAATQHSCLREREALSESFRLVREATSHSEAVYQNVSNGFEAIRC